MGGGSTFLKPPGSCISTNMGWMKTMQVGIGTKAHVGPDPPIFSGIRYSRRSEPREATILQTYMK